MSEDSLAYELLLVIMSFRHCQAFSCPADNRYSFEYCPAEESSISNEDLNQKRTQLQAEMVDFISQATIGTDFEAIRLAKSSIQEAIRISRMLNGLNEKTE